MGLRDPKSARSSHVAGRSDRSGGALPGSPPRIPGGTVPGIGAYLYGSLTRGKRPSDAVQGRRGAGVAKPKSGAKTVFCGWRVKYVG